MPLRQSISQSLNDNGDTRVALGWGVRDLAEKAGISPNTVARFENEKNKFQPSRATLKLIRQAFESAGVLFTESGVEPPKTDQK